MVDRYCANALTIAVINFDTKFVDEFTWNGVKKPMCIVPIRMGCSATKFLK